MPRLTSVGRIPIQVVDIRGVPGVMDPRYLDAIPLPFGIMLRKQDLESGVEGAEDVHWGLEPKNNKRKRSRSETVASSGLDAKKSKS